MQTTAEPVQQSASNQGNPSAVTVLVVSPVQIPPPLHRVRPAVLPFRRTHMFFGIIHMSIAVLCIILETFTLILSAPYACFGAGEYCGLVIFTAGLLGLLAGKNNNTCCLIGCMVMNIIATCVSVIGVIFTCYEMEYSSAYASVHFYDVEPDTFIYAPFVYRKCVFMLIALIFEFFFTVIHSTFTCVSCCYCCLKQKNTPNANQTSQLRPVDNCCYCCYPSISDTQPRQLITTTIEGMHLLPSFSTQQHTQLGAIYQPDSRLTQSSRPFEMQPLSVGGHSSVDMNGQPPPSYADVMGMKPASS